VATGNGIFVVSGFSNVSGGLFLDTSLNGILLTSSNGVDWTRRNPATSLSIWGTRFLNGSFFRVGNGGAILEDAMDSCIRLAGHWNSEQGLFEITIDGGVGQSFQLQSRVFFEESASIDRAEVSSTSSRPVKFSDPTSTLQSQRFYRVAGP
jgi:hypothetical protein